MNEIELTKKSFSHWQIVLNRPEKYNAITINMYQRIIQILDEATNDEQLTLLSITGKGKFYSAGTDLTNPFEIINSTSIDFDKSLDQSQILLKTFIQKFIDFPKVLIAFINGPAVGISVSILGLFDGVYASSRSTFSMPFTATGQSPEGCSSWIFPSLMGSIHAKQLLLFGHLLTVQQAQQRGLVTQIIPEDKFEQEMEEICEEILLLPRQSVLTSKKLIQQWNQQILHQVNQQELQTLKERWTSEEFLQAIIHFNNKQKNKSKL